MSLALLQRSLVSTVRRQAPRPQHTSASFPLAASPPLLLGRPRRRRAAAMGGEATSAGGGGFRARMEHYLYSGEKKHVVAGIAIFAAVFGVPWYFMTRGAKHESHQDYMERANKARSERLSSGQPSAMKE
ncbi:hypothetical protein GQ55_5G514300 [Panicum hallii var. hallii]|uniref:Uncharacterized protein n=1 Tax=Panicum hallii var. hallii TaxID=1504633 RepID=A0A2T7DSF1_9POAL|nr:hypothetical protein GQ55_5G514300 [Panicum hallii var. hallii]